METFEQYMEVVASMAVKPPATFDHVYWEIERKTRGELSNKELHERAVRRCRKLGINPYK